MKARSKNLLAGALAAGLMVCGTGKVRALVSDNMLAPALNVQLTVLTLTGKGKVQRTRITNKDLLNSLGLTAKGDQFVYAEGHVWVADRHDVLLEDLTEDGTFEISVEVFSSFDKISGDGSFKDSFAGTAEVFFASAGGGDVGNSDVTFDLSGTYSAALVGSRTLPNGKVFETLASSISALGNSGFDDNISGDPMPMSGGISMNANGFVFPDIFHP